MRTLIGFFLAIAVVVAPTLAASQNQLPDKLSVEVIVTKWRNSVRANKQIRSRIAMLVSDSSQDGIPGRLADWGHNLPSKCLNKAMGSGTAWHFHGARSGL
jgi:hypothetical protein